MAKSDKSALPERRSLGRLVGAEQRESFSARSKRPNRRVTVHIERKSHRPTDKNNATRNDGTTAEESGANFCSQGRGLTRLRRCPKIKKVFIIHPRACGRSVARDRIRRTDGRTVHVAI
eukprot:31519-Pelagococcus_subviridis.AAC.9